MTRNTLAEMEVIPWRRHRCTTAHRSVKAFLMCALRGCQRQDINGRGGYALIHECGHAYGPFSRQPTVIYRIWLYRSRTELAAAYATELRIHERGTCSGTCKGMPRAVLVVLP